MRFSMVPAAGMLLLALALLPGGRPAASGDPFVVIEAAELRAQPVDGAASRGRLEAGAAVQRQQRSGGWLRVRQPDGGREGWLRLWQIRPAAEDGGNPLLRGLQRFSRSIAGLFRAGGDSGLSEQPVTATIGVRGLDAGDFEQAAPDPGALRSVQALRPDRGQAAAFARAAGLQRREIAVLESHQSQDWGEW